MNQRRRSLPSRPHDKSASNEWQATKPRTPAAGRPARAARAALPVRRAPAWEVTPADLACLDAVRSLLSALDNAYASTRQIHALVLDIPVLAARCVRRIGVKQNVTPELLERALTTIGNMGLEAELLGLLEDLTTCRADLLEAEQRRSEAPGAG